MSRLSLLVDLAALLAREVDLDALLATACERVAQALHADRASIWLVDAERGDLVTRVALLPEVPNLRLPIDRGIADNALGALEVDSAGLDAMDRRYLTTIAMNYGGGPVGVETMAAALSEPRDAIEDIIEPYLIQCGYLQRTPRGRLLTSHAFRHLGLAEPARDPAQFGLFGGAEDEQ